MDKNGNKKLTVKNEKERAIIAIGNQSARSAWDKAVKQYAIELLESLEGNYTGAALLNGAENWRDYSYGGCSLIYDYEIAERLCSPSELKRSKYGEKQPNPRETWLDCQARALGQAATRICRLIKERVSFPAFNPQPSDNMKRYELTKTTSPRTRRFYCDGKRVSREYFELLEIQANFPGGRTDTIHSTKKGDVERSHKSITIR